MKTSELTGAALDWAVQQYESVRKDIDLAWWTEDYSPSTIWAQAGPIIEREKIEIRWSNNQWIAMWWADNSGMAKHPAQRFLHNRQTTGETPLIAAMRCYVAAKMGEEVDVPAELED